MIINVNGKICSEDDAAISVLDHGFLFGDSVYEVVRTHKGKLFTAKEHLERLQRSANRLMMELPLTFDQFKDELIRTHKILNVDEAYMRLIVTRGVGALELHPASCKTQNYIIMAKPIDNWGEELYSKGMSLSIVSVLRNDPYSLDPKIKSGNYLNNVLAIIEAKNKGADEGLMCNKEGFVSEGTNFNVFMVKDNVLITPELASGILEGITRMVILRLARENSVLVDECKITPDDIKSADEVFISSSTRDIMPVYKIDNTMLPTPTPGKITTFLAQKFQQFLEDSVA
ncbi:MAG: aminotransferase class IV [Planctomycetes bacterium]|nr:aminotransferase class IV [Planctomycetota bacterium]